MWEEGLTEERDSQDGDDFDGFGRVVLQQPGLIDKLDGTLGESSTGRLSHQTVAVHGLQTRVLLEMASRPPDDRRVAAPPRSQH